MERVLGIDFVELPSGQLLELQQLNISDVVMLRVWTTPPTISTGPRFSFLCN